MADSQNDGNIRISGRFGEVFIVTRPLVIPISNDPIPGPPVGIKLMEVESIQATKERTFVDVDLPGTGETGSKRSTTTKAGTLTVQHILPEWQAYVNAVQFSGTLDERRAARDAGQRLNSKLVMQVWNDDDASLAAEGWQIDGVDMGMLEIGFDQTDVLTRTIPFRLDDITAIRGAQRIGGTVDPVSGLPAIQYFVGAPS